MNVNRKASLQRKTIQLFIRVISVKLKKVVKMDWITILATFSFEAFLAYIRYLKIPFLDIIIQNIEIVVLKK